MSFGLLYLLKALMFWLGLLGLARTLWLFASTPLKSWSSAIATVLLLGISASLPSLPGAQDAGFNIPVVLPILPTETFLILPALVFAFVSLGKAVTAITSAERSSALWRLMCGLLVTGLLFKVALASKTQVEFKDGVIGLTWTHLVILVPLAVCAVLAIGAANRTAVARNLARNVGLYGGLVAGSLVFGLPMVWMLSTSFRENDEINSGTGIRWIPVVQPREPYQDPVHPYFRVTVNGTQVEGVVLQTRADGYRVIDIRRPLFQLGQTVSVAPSNLVQIPEMKPEVDVATADGPLRALDLETLPNGSHRIHLLRGANSDLIVDAGKLTPVHVPGFRFENYGDALEFLPAGTLHGLVYLKNTLTIVILSVIGAVMSAAVVAYAFARLRFPGKKFLFTLLLSTMMLPSAVTLMPQFLIFRELGWVDTLKPLWAPAFFASAFNVFMLRQFYSGIPIELEEAAKLDGCSIPKTFWSISLPQIKPALATIAIWTAVASWNNFTGPLIYISSPENMPLSYAVQLFQGQRSNEPAMLMAFVTMSVIPVVGLFLFAQRYFSQNVISSGLGGR